MYLSIWDRYALLLATNLYLSNASPSKLRSRIELIWAHQNYSSNIMTLVHSHLGWFIYTLFSSSQVFNLFAFFFLSSIVYLVYLGGYINPAPGVGFLSDSIFFHHENTIILSSRVYFLLQFFSSYTINSTWSLKLSHKSFIDMPCKHNVKNNFSPISCEKLVDDDFSRILNSI